MMPVRVGVATALACLAACSTGGGTEQSQVPPLTRPAAATSTTVATPTTINEDRDAPLAGLGVVIDPGHNGANFANLDEINALVDIGIGTKACNTTGTETADGVAEAEINFAVATAVRDRLVDRGADVTMTRTDNDGWGPCITERAAIGNEAGADAVISIHADGAPAEVRGFHIIRPSLIEGFTDDIAAESERLAVALRDAFVATGIPPADYLGVDGIDERGDLGGLVLSDVPVVFIEMGNLRNPDDAATLTDPAGQAASADAIVAGLSRFLLDG